MPHQRGPGGRSANRGECAQACRMPYELISDGKQVPLGGRKYLLSPQDLAGLEVLPELIRAGVASLKIEGRLKSPEYVANITRIYRQALDKLRRDELHESLIQKLDSQSSSLRMIATTWRWLSVAACTPAGSAAPTTSTRPCAIWKKTRCISRRSHARAARWRDRPASKAR